MGNVIISEDSAGSIGISMASNSSNADSNLALDQEDALLTARAVLITNCAVTTMQKLPGKIRRCTYGSNNANQLVDPNLVLWRNCMSDP